MKKTNHNEEELTDNLNNHKEEENPATEPKEESVNKKIEITEGEEKEEGRRGLNPPPLNILLFLTSFLRRAGDTPVPAGAGWPAGSSW